MFTVGIEVQSAMLIRKGNAYVKQKMLTEKGHFMMINKSIY